MLLNTIQQTLLTCSKSRLAQPDKRDHSKSPSRHPCYDTIFAAIKPKKCSKQNQKIKRKPYQSSSIYVECHKAIPSEELLIMLDKVVAIL